LVSVSEEGRQAGSPDVEDAGSGVSDGGVDGAAVRAVAGGVVEHVEVGGGREELLVVGRRSLPLPFRVVDDEPLGIAGERVEAELEGAVGRGGSHFAEAEKEAESGGRWPWRDADEEAARHQRVGGEAHRGLETTSWRTAANPDRPCRSKCGRCLETIWASPGRALPSHPGLPSGWAGLAARQRRWRGRGATVVGCRGGRERRKLRLLRGRWQTGGAEAVQQGRVGDRRCPN
jgi:hypothetical protein